MQEGRSLGKRAARARNREMPIDRAALYAIFERLNIGWRTVEHRPVFTVEEGRDLKAGMPGGHSKNLFLKDKKDALSLAVAHCDTAVDLVGLGRAIGARGRLSFGRPELMTATLGVAPGSVTPFALANAGARALSHVIVDRALLAYDPVWFHPLSNDASTAVAPEGLLAFIADCGFEPRVVNLAAPLRAA